MGCFSKHPSHFPIRLELIRVNGNDPGLLLDGERDDKHGYLTGAAAASAGPDTRLLDGD